jgi:hypothetical protein
MNICPTCHRRIPASRKSATVKIYKRLEQDIARANAAIEALATCEQRLGLTGPEWRQAIESESRRLSRALTGHHVLWAIYRRTDKSAPYYGAALIPGPLEPQSVTTVLVVAA